VIEFQGYASEGEADPLAVDLLRKLMRLPKPRTAEERFRLISRLAPFLAGRTCCRPVTVRLGNTDWQLSSLRHGWLREVFTWEYAGPALVPPGQSSQIFPFDYFVSEGDETQPVGMGEVHVLAECGVSVISDIDDTTKITNVRSLRELLRNTFCRPFTAVPGMAQFYQQLGRIHQAHFHYISASPIQLLEPLQAFMREAGFPNGTFHLRPFRLRDRRFREWPQTGALFKARAIRSLLERFPGRQFILIGDSGERDPEIYGRFARSHARNVIRVIIRKIDGTAEEERYAKAFRGVNHEILEIRGSFDA
jgi:hypothetical protein